LTEVTKELTKDCEQLAQILFGNNPKFR